MGATFETTETPQIIVFFKSKTSRFYRPDFIHSKSGALLAINIGQGFMLANIFDILRYEDSNLHHLARRAAS